MRFVGAAPFYQDTNSDVARNFLTLDFPDPHNIISAVQLQVQPGAPAKVLIPVASSLALENCERCDTLQLDQDLGLVSGTRVNTKRQTPTRLGT